eukprot:8024828-Pyramimonas_sp.AAC.1
MSLAAFRIVEDEVEGIHRTVHVESTRARASRIPWLSATSTAEADLEYIDNVLDLPDGEDLVCREWDAYKRIIQKPPVAATRRRSMQESRQLLRPRLAGPWGQPARA